MTRAVAISLCLLAAWSGNPVAANDDSHDLIAAAAKEVEPKVITWRRDIHQHPELGNREFRTAGLVADHLRALGFEVETGVAHTGVVGVLTGGKPGSVVAIRADMDALPVKEMVDLPFASKARGEYNGQEVPVMHACGHDNHVAILMGVAEVLADLRETLPGTVKLIFQPAEEGPPAGEDGGAKLMVEQGVLDTDPKPQAIFGLHVGPLPTGTLNYRPAGALAAADGLEIVVEGEQTHGSSPWLGVDPVTAAAQIITALQTIPSRQLDITKAPAVVSIGSIHGGVRGNIIPDRVDMLGTIRTFDPEMREDFLKRITKTAETVAAAAGAKATVTITPYAPVTYNDPALTAEMLPTLAWAAGSGDKVVEVPRIMGAEDFAFYQKKIPGFYFFLGVNKEGVGAYKAPTNHSPYFYANEDALIVGVRALAGAAWDYLEQAAP